MTVLNVGRVAPELSRAVILVRLRGSERWWPTVREPELAVTESRGLAAWHGAAQSLASLGEVAVYDVSDVSADSLVELASSAEVDLLVAAVQTLDASVLLARVARRLGVAVLRPAPVERPGAVAHLLCVALGERGRSCIAGFLRDQADPSLEVTVIGPEAMPSAAALELAGIHARVRVTPRRLLGFSAMVEAAGRDAKIDLVVVPRVPAPLLFGFAWPAPVLMLPLPERRDARARPLDVADVVMLKGKVRVRVDEVTLFGTLAPAAEVSLGLAADGRVVARVRASSSGDIELPASSTAGTLAVVRVVDESPPDMAQLLEQSFTLVAAGEHEQLPFDAELPSTELERLLHVARSIGAEPLAVRLRPTTRVNLLRERLRSAGIRPLVLDARAILDEGEAHDVSETNDEVRLRRAARRLRAAGYPLAGVFDAAIGGVASLDDRVSPVIAGNRVAVELDNARARAWLLDEVARSRGSVNLQVYMAADDEIGRLLEAQLVAAAARGVTVRFLVDSLHGLHGSFGAENALLSRLAAQRGITVRAVRPLAGLPRVSSLKRRDHRKLVVVDERVALVGGRNLSYEYYTGFGEARLCASTPWRKVPWLDAGVRIEGPAVGAVSSAFLDAWTEAGGAPFAVAAPAPLGATAARVVVHRGLEDAHSLETYLELIEQARGHIYAVNGFPYVLELQHALLAAIERGVRVRALAGHLTPMHDQTPFPGPWSGPRATATELVHSRLDPLVERGGEVYLFAQPELSGWEPGLGTVHPHVHAKLMSVDGRRCAVGSANFDVTSAYWESELMMVIEDPGITAELESTLDQLLAGSTRVRREDPAWRERALRRRWMRRWPGALAL